MKKLGTRLLLISFIFALLAAGSIFIYLNSLKSEEKHEETVTILVASQLIPPRTRIESNMIEEIEVSADSVYGSFIHNKNQIVGKYSKEAIVQHDQFHEAKLIDEIEKDLSLKLEGNNRAVSVYVNGESGVADLIKVGDKVDIVVFLPEIKESGNILRPSLSRLLLQNIEILAIDKLHYRTEEERLESPQNWLLTLSVSVYDLEKLVLAQNIGQIRFALRPLDENTIYKTEGTVWQELLLDDFYQMKDLTPQYEMKPISDSQVNYEDYSYSKYYYYTIEYGDTLRKISEKFYGSPDHYNLLKQVNHILDENQILSGTGLKIPVLDDEG